MSNKNTSTHSPGAPLWVGVVFVVICAFMFIGLSMLVAGRVMDNGLVTEIGFLLFLLSVGIIGTSALITSHSVMKRPGDTLDNSTDHDRESF